ncbi:MAG: UDP-N-acetylglucosamine 1-carboxyvinyltransferase [Eubacteriales bacterium]
MEQIIINGGSPLYGNVSIGGMKNAALPVICACVLNEETCIIDNIPPVSDIEILLEILSSMGAYVNRLTKYSVEICCKNLIPCSSPMELANKLRGSSYLLGAEFGRFGKASVSHPGGCSIGARPLDLHMKAFEALGADCCHKNGRLEVESENGRALGNNIYFDKVSVGATANAILASVLADGVTTIDNAAREPHIVDLAVFLNACGANITGAGTSVIKIKGVEKLHGCRYSIIPDMIEAGTYMAAVAATSGRVTVTNVIPKHLEAITSKLEEAGVTATVGDDFITIESTGKLKGISIVTQPYPGFATDMQAQFGAMLCFAEGTSDIVENIFNSRFQYTDELSKMGADIKVDGNHAVIRGGAKLTGAPLMSHDLRGGAAMVIAALATPGRSVIEGIDKIERGYHNIVGKLRDLGADIQKKSDFSDEQIISSMR